MFWKYIGMIIAAAVVLFVVFSVVKAITKRLVLSNKPLPIDEMDGREFERFCAHLLERRGFVDVNITKASGDFGVDILAEKEGITYAIQCKRYADPVGVKAIQEAFAGREYYDCMVGAVLTNQYFTAPAVEAAKKLKILLWDRGYLERMMEELED